MKKISIKNGFTLLEVMISVAIFSVVALVCLQSYLLSLKEVEIVDNMQAELLLASWKIEEMKASDFPVSEDIGIFPQPYGDYEWEISLSDESFSDTVAEITVVPYVLKISGIKSEFSTITPFFSISGED